jgi:glycosyltransferase involved in cell wall biosynthesis
MRPGYHSRIIFDVSTSLRWAGPPSGIVRVERELALWAHDNVADVLYAFFDPNHLQYQSVPEQQVKAFLVGNASIDTLGMSNPTGLGRRRTDRIPSTLKPAAMWFLQFRHTLLQTLERIRLRAKASAAADTVDKLQRLIMSAKYRTFMLNQDGTRRVYLPWNMAFGGNIELQPSDILICAGCGWAHTNIRAISRLKARIGFDLALLCHDIIPLQFPRFYKARDVEMFGDYFEVAFPLADLVIFTSRKVEEDARTYCRERAITMRRTAVSPLGASSDSSSAEMIGLPAGLQAGQYALLVSTIEPRKGHRMIYEVWRRLLQEGIPQAMGFKLLFVGQPGWMVDDLIRLLAKDPCTANSLHLMSGVEDSTLAALYRGAAFCLYPSAYEGYGLPVFEAFCHGKAVLVSSGGALREIAGEFSPQLDPNDQESWYRSLKSWIVDPGVRVPFEQAIRTRFRHPSWAEAAAAIFALIEELPMLHRLEGQRLTADFA